jgi:hypothetical protein
MSGTILCCGQPRTSRYCPDCGEKLRREPIDELVSHCKTQEKKALTQASRFREHGGYGEQEECNQYARKQEEAAARWKSWYEAIRDLMARPHDPQ